MPVTAAAGAAAAGAASSPSAGASAPSPAASSAGGFFLPRDRRASSWARIHLRPWSCGSMIRGHRLQFVMIAPFSMEMRSAGRPSFIHMAPEMLLQRAHTRAVDWWGLGLLAHEMVASRHPFQGASHGETLRNMVRAGAGNGCDVPDFKVVFHSFRLIFGRAIISRSDLEAWMLSVERARAERSR